MPIAKLCLIKRSAEFLPKEKVKAIPNNIRGIYLLYIQVAQESYEAVYVGLSRGKKLGIKSRLLAAKKSKRRGYWTHFSIYEVHQEVTEAQVREIEGLLRHVYRKDERVHRFNEQRGFTPLMKRQGVRQDDLNKW